MYHPKYVILANFKINFFIKIIEILLCLSLIHIDFIFFADAFAGTPVSDVDAKVAAILHEESATPNPATWEQLGVRLFVGRVDGTLVAPRGPRTFGWDPAFVPTLPPGTKTETVMTFAEMPADLKNTLSHRSNALRLLRDYLSRFH